MAAVIDLMGDAAPSDPPAHAAAVTPSDSADLPHVTTRLWLGTLAAGATLAVLMVGGEQVTFTFGNAAALNGQVLEIRAVRVLATGTAGITNIVALWR